MTEGNTIVLKNKSELMTFFGLLRLFSVENMVKWSNLHTPYLPKK